MVAVGAIDEARARSFRDCDVAGERLDWANVVDRTGVALRAMTYQTPETAHGMVTGEKGRGELEATWASLRASERQLWRRRAVIALEISVLVFEA